MVNHWKCVKCGSMNVEIKSPKKVEVEAVLYTDEKGKYDGDEAFEVKEEKSEELFLECKDCHNTGSLKDKSKFVLMPDTD